MKNKYWAKKKYSQVDPVDYALQRFSTPAGKLIDAVEKKAVLDLLLSSGIAHKRELKILDVATGPGRLAFYLEEHLRKAEIKGVDINENMLKRAKQTAQKKGSKVNFIKGDIYNLPFKDNQFDAVVGLRFSMHLPDFPIVLKELSRILKKDGLLIFDIFNYHSVLQLRLMNSHNKKEDCGFYTIGELARIARNYKFEFLGYKGILFLGETLLREFPGKLLFLFSYIINPPKLIERFSTKLILCIKKNE